MNRSHARMRTLAWVVAMAMIGPGAMAQNPVPKVTDHWSHVDRNVEGFFTPPYHSTPLLYGYYDYAPRRGPLITLGSRSLLPGFRGYGLLLSPGYGAGLRPTSRIDLDHFNGGPWYHKFPDRYLFPRDLNIDPLAPQRKP